MAILAPDSASTARQYKDIFRAFAAFCDENKYPSLPTTPEILASYLLDQAAAGMKPSKLDRIIAGVKWAHRLSDLGGKQALHLACSFDDPIIPAVLRFVRRNWEAEHKKKSDA
jgi:hypothetical protein